MSGGTGQAAAAAGRQLVDDRLAQAHRALIADPSVQFELRPAMPDPPPPQWLVDFGEWLERVLKPVGAFFGWISSLMPDAPYARIFLWTVIAVGALLIVWMIWQRFRHGEWRLPRRRRRIVAQPASVEEEAWAPDAGPAREWLREADALAERGRFAEAVHHLLIRSVEDIARRRPHIVRPALTSRDLARAEAIPPAARTLFSDIAAVVERSLFGERPVDATQWSACRAAYADFAQPQMWKR